MVRRVYAGENDVRGIPMFEYRILRTEYYTPPGPIFKARHLHSSWNSATGTKKVDVGNTSPRRELSEDVSFVVGALWLSSNRAWKTAPGVCVTYTVLYGIGRTIPGYS